MDFLALILFLAFYYLRPQEWFADFNALRPVQLLSGIALFAMFRARKLNPRDLVRTPLDWLVLFYFLWTLVAGFQFSTTVGEIEAVLLFYFVAVRSLDTVPRLKTFLKWWCFLILIIATLAIASLYGFDPLHSNDLTQGYMKGRLILNLSVFNNPNALAHSVIPAVPLLFYFVFWRRVFMKAGLILLAIPLYCIFLTQSKGAFLCGFATILCTLILSRARITQLIVIILAVAFGYGALFALPRMNELNHAKSDDAIQGRVAALSYGMQLMRSHFFGIGLGNFTGMFIREGPVEIVRSVQIIPAHDTLGNEGLIHHIGAKRLVTYFPRHYGKSTHSTYNQNGAELGYVGLFLFVGILYCCIRTLLLVKSHDDDEERIRRALFAMVVAYAVSSWMVDFCYRPTFLILVAAVSAFHRHLLRKQEAEGKVVEQTPALPDRPWLRRLPPIRLPGIPIPGLVSPLPAGSAACLTAEMVPAAIQPAAVRLPPRPGAAGSGRVLPWHKPEPSLEDTLRKKFIWTRLGVMDFLITLALTWATILYWQHLIVTM
jgi:hypothetical protein